MQKTPIGMRKSNAHDDHDAHDDDLRWFSKGSAALSFADERSSLDNEVVGMVKETMQPEHASLWLCSETTRKDEQAQ
jgi:hypothetical protein